MSFLQVQDILAYWNRYPPIVELLAGFMGIEQPKARRDTKPGEMISEEALMMKMRADLAMLGQL